MMDPYLQDLETNSPFIAWREPVPIQVVGKDGISQTGVRWGCRVCMSMDGLAARDVEMLPVERDIMIEHIARVHLA